MLGKRAALATAPAHSPFVDPEGCKEFVASAESGFRARLAQAGQGSAP